MERRSSWAQTGGGGRAAEAGLAGVDFGQSLQFHAAVKLLPHDEVERVVLRAGQLGLAREAEDAALPCDVEEHCQRKRRLFVVNGVRLLGVIFRNKDRFLGKIAGV